MLITLVQPYRTDCYKLPTKPMTKTDAHTIRRIRACLFDFLSQFGAGRLLQWFAGLFLEGRQHGSSVQLGTSRVSND